MEKVIVALITQPGPVGQSCMPCTDTVCMPSTQLVYELKDSKGACTSLLMRCCAAALWPPDLHH